MNILINQIDNDYEIYYSGILDLSTYIREIDWFDPITSLPLDSGDYRIVFSANVPSFYPITRTFEFTHSTDTREPYFILNGMECDNNQVGDIAHLKVQVDSWEKFDKDIYLGVGTTNYSSSFEDFNIPK